jgi:ATP-dependent DNA helicase RecG
LAQLGISTLEDLLRHAPRAYQDRGVPVPCGTLVDVRDGFAVVRGTVRKASLARRGRRATLRASLEDGSGTVSAIWFNAAFLAKEVTSGREMVWAGRVSGDGTLIQPELAAVDVDEAPPARLTGIRPAYPVTEGISQRMVWDLVEHALHGFESVPDPLPPAALELSGLPALGVAIRWAHRPRTMEEAERGCSRLLFDELLPLELAMKRRLRARRERVAPPTDGRGGGAQALAAVLPFELSESQRIAVQEIVEDLHGGCPMGRLLAGDVGAGKTAVALAGLQEARSLGLQGALLAPTDVLARQHDRTIRELLPEDDGVVLLTGTLAAAEAREVRERLASGHAGLAVGTHALFSEATRFARLGLVVIDEQHRFGVDQREALLGKAETPHCLVLSATPIPRTLALLGLGDLELSMLDPRPGARGPVETRVVPRAKRAASLRWVRDRLREGEQAFLVRPRIEGEDGARELHEELDGGLLRDIPTALLHGRLDPVERDARLDAFRNGEAAALVATTLVEVGLDVPGASILWIEGADRLGLAQIHQLRGRIARRGQKGYCWLVEDAEPDEAVRTRLQILEDVDDGLRLAEIDLATRGPGELLGVRQSGRMGPFAGWGASAPARLAELAVRASRVADLLMEDSAWSASASPS